MKGWTRVDWPLVGRDEELAAAEAALGRGGVVPAGPAGVGKTRMAREVVQRARREGRETEWLAATAECAAAARARRQPVVVGIDDAQLLDEGPRR